MASTQHYLGSGLAVRSGNGPDSQVIKGPGMIAVSVEGIVRIGAGPHPDEACRGSLLRTCVPVAGSAGAQPGSSKSFLAVVAALVVGGVLLLARDA
jgi:hypothetical protein